MNYFKIAKCRNRIKDIESWIRRRIRACIWKQWKKVKTSHRKLIKIGINKQKSWEYANTRKGYLRIAKSPILSRTLTNAYLEELGYKSLVKRYQLIH
ncbi:group II intron maturase-specific domain-containing protein [Vallitalea maricola]|uniref:group II intron maturase-specific domain-containing protein n=1 Tax=Vallitalea maricola TaxID=3074433 RepID=UPI0033657B1B